MNKGKVIDIQKKYAVVMNDQMAYEKIEKRNGLSVGKEIYYFEEDLYKEIKRPGKKYFLVAAVLFMMLFIQPLLVAEEAYGYISVDINPSIQLEVDRDLQVLAVEAINYDGETIIEEEWTGKDAKEVITLIIEETKISGLLNDTRDFVLVSYYFNDDDSTSELNLLRALDELFNDKAHDYEVAVIKSDAINLAEAKEAKESIGKQIVNKKMDTEVEDLLTARESIKKDQDFKIYKKEINDNDTDEILEDNPGHKNEKNPIFVERDDRSRVMKKNSNNINNDDYDDEDDYDDDEYSDDYKSKGKMITLSEAKAIALGLVNGKVVKIDRDGDTGEGEYEITIRLKEKEHEIIIDGLTGKVTKHEIDSEKSGNKNNKDNSNNKIMERKSIEAIVHKEISGHGEIIDFNFDEDDGEYEIEVKFDDKIHDIKINGITGEIIEHEIENMDKDHNEENNNKNNKKNNNKNQIMGRKSIEEIVYREISDHGEIIEFNFDEDDGEYEIEVKFDDKIHDIKINGFTGEIIEHEIERIDKDHNHKGNEAYNNNNNNNNNNSSKNNQVMGRKSIEAIVFREIGDHGEIIEFNFDEEDGEYEIEVTFDDKIHDIKINGFTGEIIEHETEDVDQEDDMRESEEFEDEKEE